MTEEQIEDTVCRCTDRIDASYMASAITCQEYEAEIIALNKWAEAEYERLACFLAHQEGRREMTEWSDTAEAAAFIASADSRETSPEILRAIAFFARDRGEAEALWNGEGFGVICHPTDLWEHVTGNGRVHPTEFFWGASGSDWWPMEDLLPAENQR